MPKRRANGEGNIRKRKDGRWEGRYTVGHDPETGKAIIKNVLGKTQAEVKEKLKKVLSTQHNFRNKTCIFCAAVVNKKAFQQRRNCVAIDKDKAARLRGANDNFLITVPPLDSFPLLVTVLFVGKGG